MTHSLLDTKFYAPRPRSDLVPRPRLTQRLDQGTQSRLTLVSAPAGFGKSTLVADWLATMPADGWATAWLSLDSGDNHPGVFWAHVIAALQTVAPEVGASASALLESPDRSIENVLAPLLNELNSVGSDIVLVLDDYHSIDAPEIQAGMAFMLERLPVRVHLVITTRADPALPLARLRARGELIEVRAGDLRFTPEEAEVYFNGKMTLGLTAQDVATLESRTEGWIVALQLAALSMRGRDDIASFISGFAGDDRYIVDYLVEEVWHRQPDDVQGFLLQTSILARMNGPLCDAVTGQQRGRATLEALDRRNLFLIPLDDQRRWYRYHHLFADVLQARLLDEQPGQVPELHRRATEWYAEEGEHAEAIRHAVAGGDLARAADLVELAIPATRQHRQEGVLRQWLEMLPDELIRTRPVLSNAYAGSILVRGGVDGVDERLRDAERWLDAMVEPSAGRGARPSGMVVVDEEAFRDLPGSIAIHRSGLARARGDVAGTIEHAQRALGVIREDDHYSRGGVAALLGLAHWTNADLEAAYRLYAEAAARFERVGFVSDAIGCAIVMADLQIARGRLHDAHRTYERGLRLATPLGEPVVRGAADMLVGMSELARERNDLGAATEHLRAAQRLGDEKGLPQNPYRSCVAMARIRHAAGDLTGALGLLGEAEHLYVTDFSPAVRPIPALKARVLVAAGRLSEASAWARDRGISTADDLSYVQEFEHVTLAKVMLAQGTRDRSDRTIREILDFLSRLLTAAEGGDRTGSVIDILIVQALAHHLSGDSAAALGSLTRVVELAEPEGYVRVFLDEGPSLATLLRLAAKQPNAPASVRRMLASAVQTEDLPPVGQALIEPLSERELDVLRLLDSDLDGPAIARELVVSLPTVRTHTRNIYAKLSVNNRRSAVRRATELGLLASSQGRRPTT